MKSLFHLTLCLVALAACPLAVMAQGFGGPGQFGPGLPDNQRKKDRDDLSGIPRIPIYGARGVTFPGPQTNSPAPGSRFPGAGGAPLPTDPSEFTGRWQPSPEIKVRPEFTPEAHPMPRFNPETIKVPAHEFTFAKPSYLTEFRPSSLAMGRGGVGLIGGIGGAIAAMFRALFGRRKE